MLAERVAHEWWHEVLSSGPVMPAKSPPRPTTNSEVYGVRAAVGFKARMLGGARKAVNNGN